jgi:MFS family permease
VEPPAAPTRLLTSAFGLVLAATTGVFATFGVLVLALPLYVRDELGRSDLAVGIAVGAASIGAILVGPPSGRFADRRGRRLVMAAGAVVMAAGYVALALEPPLGAIVPIRAVAGAAEAAFVVAAWTVAADLAPEGRTGEAVSLVTAGAYIGLALGPLAGDFIVSSLGYPLVWTLAAAVVHAAGVAGVLLPETRHPHEDAADGWMPPRAALLPGLVLLLALLGFGGFNAFAALHAREVGLERPGVVFLVFAGIVVLVRVFGRTLPDRLGARIAASAACISVVVGLLVLAGWQTVPGLLIGTAIFAAGQALAYPAVAVLASARAPKSEQSATFGAVIAFVDIALLSGALVLSVAAEAAGYGAVFLAGAISAALALALLMRITAAPREAPA